MSDVFEGLKKFLATQSTLQHISCIFSRLHPLCHCGLRLIPAGLPHQLQLLLHCLPNLGPNEKSLAVKPNRSKVKSRMESRGFSSKRAQILATRCGNSCCCCCCLVVILQFLHFIYLSIADIFSCL